MYHAYAASEIFTGETWLFNYAVIVSKGLIQEIIPRDDISEDISIEDMGQTMLIPAFIDVQVYGAAHKLFAQYPQVETLEVMREDFLKNGTVVFLPTIATNPNEVIKKCVDAIKDYKKKYNYSVPGLHLEGPWFNEKRRGAHKKEWIHSPSIKEVRDLLEYAEGSIKMITLAPEICTQEIIELILSFDVIISAGHSDATFDEAMEGFKGGISAVTHLYNAMSPLHHREPGLVGAALINKDVMVSIIPDGYHVAYEAIDIAKSIMGQRLYAITDAVTQTNEGPYRHQLAGEKYECDGILSGSALNMHQAFVNLYRHTGIGLDESIRMCSQYPARLLGYEGLYGKIAPQHAGQFLVINKQLEIVKVITSI